MKSVNEDSLRRLLNGNDAIIYEAGSFPEVEDVMTRFAIDLVILDMNMPGGSGIQTLEAVRSRHSSIRILIYSVLDEILYGMRYLNAGANGFVAKSSSNTDLKNAISTVLDNKRYLGPGLLEHLSGSVEGQDRKFHRLSNREIEVANLLVKGLGPLEIANQLNLHVASISTYKIRIMKKLQVNNLVDLIDIFRSYGQ